jgi:flavodoxin
MKSVVIYFSLTGNTEKVAKAIQEGIHEATGSCDIIKISDANPQHFFKYDYDLIGIGTPTWGGPVPAVMTFINDLLGVGGKHAFVFYTHGTIPFHVVPRITPPMKSKGLTVIGWNGWYGDHPWPWALYPYPTAGHPDEIDLKEAKNFGREMVERSQRIAAGEKELIPNVPEDWLEEGYPVQGLWDTLEYGAVKYDKEKCKYPKCKLCMENCWSHSIDLSLDPPRIANPCCEHCVWCAMICPTGAMNIDDYLDTQLPNFARLEVEHALPNLARGDAKGQFIRRLVPKEEIGKMGHFADVFNRHPMWVIGKGPVTKRKKTPDK